MFAVAKTKKKKHPQPHLLDVLERDLLALPGRHGEDVHLQRGQSERGVVLQLRPEPLQAHVVTTLRGKGGKARFSWESRRLFLGLVRSVSSVRRAARAARVHPPSAEWSSRPLWRESPSKGYSFQSWMKDWEAQKGEIWQGKKKKRWAFLLPGYSTWLIIKRILWGREK